MRTASGVAVNAALAFAVFTCGLGAGGQAQSSEEGPRASYFPDVTLKTQDNKEVRFYEDLINGKTFVINFFYTRCDGTLCDAGTRNLVQVQKALGDRLGRDVFIYSITIDPEHDTPEVLKKYADTYGAKPGWLFLTGKPEDIGTLRRKLGMTFTDLKLDANAALRTDPDARRHPGMLKIGNEAIDKWTSGSVLSRPDRILELIGRVKPPMRPSRPVD